MQEAKQAGEQPERTMEIASEGDIWFMLITALDGAL